MQSLSSTPKSKFHRGKGQHKQVIIIFYFFYFLALFANTAFLVLYFLDRQSACFGVRCKREIKTTSDN